MSMGSVRLAAFLMSLGIATSVSAQTTVTLMESLNGYAGSTDNTITSNAPTTNYGAMTTYQLRPESVNSLLIRFAIFAAEGGPVPDGATITSATLSLYKYWGPAATFKASRLKKNWSESQSTWNLAATGTAWESAGALGASDVEGTADGQGSVGDAQVDGCSTSGPWPEACWLHVDVTSGVQAFANGTPNYGWKLAFVSGPNESNAKEFNSTENTSWPSLRPKLTITYTTQPPCSPGPLGGTPAAAPGEIEAENFDCGGEGVAYHDLTPGNQSTSTYRNPESVDVMDLAGGGRTVQHFDTGEWMNYTISVAQAGYYRLAVHAASNWTPAGQVAGQYSAEAGGSSTGSVDVQSTGSWDVYAWTEAPTHLLLGAGQHVLKLRAVQQAYRVDKLRLEFVGPPPTSCDSPPQRPFGASAIQIPSGGAAFEAEDYDCGGEGIAYHDASAGNEMGSTYRPGESVDIWDIPGGGRVVRNFDTGEWMEYTINVATAGSYRLAIRAGHNSTPGQYRIEIDGNDVTGDVTVPGTGSWDVYQWVDAPNPVTLSAGQHVLRLVSALQHYRVEKLRVMPAEGGGTGAIDPADIRVWARADAPFAQQSGYTAQVINTYTAAQNIPESGIHYNQMSNGETLRLGKVGDPASAGEQALAFQVALSDPTTSGGKRAELSGPQNVVFNQVYWVALRVYVYDWGNLGTSEGSLFGTQMHSGNNNLGLSPSFAIITRDGGRNMAIDARWSTSSSPTQSNDVTARYALQPIPFGRWIDFVFKFRHNVSGSGFLQVWMDGQQIVNHTGNLGYNTPGINDYIKFGYYNWSGSGSTPRKVLLRSPVLVADPSGSKYSAEQLRAFVNQ